MNVEDRIELRGMLADFKQCVEEFAPGQARVPMLLDHIERALERALEACPKRIL